jgi:hypothetical protein
MMATTFVEIERDRRVELDFGVSDQPGFRVWKVFPTTPEAMREAGQTALDAVYVIRGPSWSSGVMECSLHPHAFSCVHREAILQADPEAANWSG